jgi:hypothetical protein
MLGDQCGTNVGWSCFVPGTYGDTFLTYVSPVIFVTVGDTFLTYVSPVIFVTVGENMLSGRNPSWEYETRREKHSGA